MEPIIAFAVCTALAYALRKPLKRYAVSFYVVAAAIDVLFLSHALFGVSRNLASTAYPYFTRCLVGFSLFSLVMYIGVLPEASKAKRALTPIRGELSIVAAILAVGHVVNYLGAYLDQILSGFAGMSSSMMASFIVSSLLIVLLSALTITSLSSVKAKMHSETWKLVQRWAYAFYGLAYLHLVLVLAPTVSQTGQRALLSIIFYTIVVLAYFMLRIAKHMRDRKGIRSTGRHSLPHS